MRLVVLLDPLLGPSPARDRRAERLRDLLDGCGEVLPCPDLHALHRALPQALQADALAVTGGDASLGAFLTAAWAHDETTPLPPLLSLAGGPSSRWVAAHLGTDGDPEPHLKRLAALARKGPSLLRRPLKPQPRPCLRLVDSSLPSPSFGFTFGLGALVPWTEALSSRSSGEGALASTLAAARVALQGATLARTPARVLLDGLPFADGCTFASASALDLLPPNLACDDALAQGHLRWAWNDMPAWSAVAPFLSPLGPRQGERWKLSQARRLVLDLPAPASYVLDGAVVTPPAGVALELRPGPNAPLASF
jgi:hypothetical protein